MSLRGEWKGSMVRLRARRQVEGSQDVMGLTLVN